MCGLFAVIGQQEIELKKVADSIQSLSHRGPDNLSIEESVNHKFGHTRLSIISPENSANQPFIKNGNSIIFNGEIYNYQDLRTELAASGITFVGESDTEVLLEGILKFGETFLTRIRGMFAFILFDNNRKRYFGARDRFGERPLLYAVHQGNLVFSSEFKSIFLYVDRPIALNHNALKLFLHYQFIPEPHTLDMNIHKLPAGSYFTVQENSTQLEIKEFWKYEDAGAIFSDNNGNAAHIPQKIENLFRQAVERNLVADVPIALSLSAGIDSGAIASMVRKINNKVDLHAFTLGYSDYPDIDERKGAERLAKELGINLHSIEINTGDFEVGFETLVDAMDEPIADPAAFSHYLIPKQAHEMGFKVLLNGIGGDEFNWGYGWLANAVENNLVPQGFKRKFAKIRKLSGSNNHPNRDYLFFYEELQEFTSIYTLQSQVELRISNDHEIELRLPGGNIDKNSEAAPRIQKALIQTWMTGNCLFLADRVGMYNSVETRMPFLDVDLTNYLIGLTIQGINANFDPKHYLKLAFKDLLPSFVLEREKTGFRIPNTKWMTAILISNSDILVDGFFVKRNMINSQKLQILIEKKNKSWHELFFLYKLILLETWFRRIHEK